MDPQILLVQALLESQAGGGSYTFKLSSIFGSFTYFLLYKSVVQPRVVLLCDYILQPIRFCSPAISALKIYIHKHNVKP